VMKNPTEYDFFTLIRELYLSGLKYADTNPKLMDIANQMIKNKNHPVYSEIMAGGKNQSSDIFENLLKLAISKGEIKADVDTKFISYLISSLSISTMEYYFEVVKGDDDCTTKIDEGIMATVNMFIGFVKDGIGAA